MVLLPRLARALNAPWIATLLGVLLVAVGIVGLATGDLKRGYGITILVVGIINLIRAIPDRQR